MKSDSIISARDKILVTGSTGFIGTRLVERLLEHGVSNIRCFARSSSRLERLERSLKRFAGHADVEFLRGDLLSRDDCKAAAREMSVVIHLAAGNGKSFESVFLNSVVATRNLIGAFANNGMARRFVQVSSFAVYSNFRMKRGALLDESSPLEWAPEQRHDAYGYGKRKQEEIVREYGDNRSLPYVIVRPGAVFGPGKMEATGRAGMRLKRLFIQVGGANRLPLTYVDNCADAIILAALRPGIEGEIFNVVDDDLPTCRQFVQAHCRRQRFHRIAVPYFAAYTFCALCDCVSWYLRPLRRLNRRRCAADWKGNQYSNQKLRQRLGWTPRVTMNQAMEQFLAQFELEQAPKDPCAAEALQPLATP